MLIGAERTKSVMDNRNNVLGFCNLFCPESNVLVDQFFLQFLFFEILYFFETLVWCSRIGGCSRVIFFRKFHYANGCVCVSAKICVMCVVQSKNIFLPISLRQCLCVFVLCFAGLCSTLHCNELHCSAMLCSALPWSAIHCIALEA